MGHFCHKTQDLQLCPSPIEISLKNQVSQRSFRSEISKKIVKARSQYRRNFKRRKARQLDDARDINKELAKHRFEPDRYTYDAKTEMHLMFAASKGFDKTVIFDLDGTLLPYRSGARSHRKTKLRPCLEELVNSLKDKVNLFVFSSGNPTRTQNIFKKHMPQGFSGYFDRSHLRRGRKCLQSLEWQGHDVVLVDDDANAIHPWSQATHIPIKRWFGETNDTELDKLFHMLKKRWNFK